jgi:hypothetical protein
MADEVCTFASGSSTALGSINLSCIYLLARYRGCSLIQLVRPAPVWQPPVKDTGPIQRVR